MKSLKNQIVAKLQEVGMSETDAKAIRRAAMQLNRWYEKECGDGFGCIERDEKTVNVFLFLHRMDADIQHAIWRHRQKNVLQIS